MEEDVDLMDFAWFNIELVQYDNDKNNFFLTIIPNMAGGPSDAVLFAQLLRLLAHQSSEHG